MPGMRCETASNTRTHPLREDTIPHTIIYVILHTSQYAIYGFHCFSLFFTDSNDGYDGYDGYMYGGTEFMKTCNYKGHIQFYCMFLLKV